MNLRQFQALLRQALRQVSTGVEAIVIALLTFSPG